MGRFKPKVETVQVIPLCLCKVGHLEYACTYATQVEVEKDILRRANILGNESMEFNLSTEA